ncbi:MAG: hypothetical protein JOZ03_00005, partial [Gammaproteobacteria bacterium]|nr:hypothetical protein [Gammaproteobacteria bacterium]
ALRGVRAHLAASEGELQVRLEATDARLAGGGAELAPLAVRAQLNVRARAQGWQLSAEDLELTQGESSLAGRFTLHGSPGQPVQLDGAATLRALELGPLASALAAHYPPLARLTEGRVERAAFEVHEALDGPLGPGRALGPRTGGTLELRELALAGAGTPALRGLDARLTLRGGELTALLRHGELQGFAIETGRVRWRPGAARGQLQARLRGRAEDALSWLRTQPALAAYAPGSDLEAQGATRLELDLTGSPEELDLARSRLTALLEGVSLRPLAGVPALEGLRGTLRLRAGELRGSVNGRWLRGPATVTVSTRSLQGSSSVTLSGRGSADLREALPTSADGPPPLSGSTDWSAQLTLQPGAPDTAFVLRAEAPLTAVVSRLPDPLAKSAGSALPLHIQAQGGADAAQLRFGVGERLNGVLALERRDAQWRIARGAVLCGAGGAPVLPEAALLSVRGALPRLDLTAYLALWQQQARAPVLPPVSAELAAQALLLGPQAYPDSELTLTAGSAGGQLELRGPELAGSLSWPSQGDGVHRAQLRLARLTLAQPEQGLAAAAGLLELFGPTLRVDIGALRGAGDLLGAVGATVSRRADELLIEDLLWQGPQLQGSGRAQCALRGGGCALNLHLASHDLATTLATLGWRPDLTAPRARLEGELHWAHSAPLATLGGHLHMQIESGQARASEVGAPFPLFVVPALLSALEPQAEDSAARVLPFQSLSADFDLERGIARTTNMHLDGEAEILVRGRVGLASGDYDSEALILRGEDRLPQPMRRLAATPRIAALWLALRGWLAGEGHGRAPPTLYLRGPWQDPTVTPAE